MTVYIILDVLGDEMGGPGDMTEIVHGVFLTEEGAFRELEHLMRYYHSTWGEKLVRNGLCAQTVPAEIPIYQIVLAEARP